MVECVVVVVMEVEEGGDVDVPNEMDPTADDATIPVPGAVGATGAGASIWSLDTLGEEVAAVGDGGLGMTRSKLATRNCFGVESALEYLKTGPTSYRLMISGMGLPLWM